MSESTSGPITHGPREVIAAQHQKIRDIQQQISDLQPLLAEADDERLEILKDKRVTLQWSLRDQKERLAGLLRTLAAES